MNLFVLIHLTFIGSFLVQLLHKRISAWRHRFEKVTHNHSAEEHTPEEISFDTSYRASKICCLLILACHSMRLMFLLLHRNGNRCKYSFSVLAEIIQSISWVFLLMAILSFQRTKTTKVPLLVRAWWICSFFQSVFSIATDLYSALMDNSLFRVGEYTDILSLLSCTYLFIISVRGKTGISFKNRSITEPLLNGSAEEHTENKRQSPYGKATLLQLVTFSWINPIFSIGYKKPLDQDEVPDIDIKDSAAFLSDSFSNILNNVRQKNGLQTSSIYKAIFLFIRKKAAINACFAVVTACASYVGPSLIDDLVKFLGGERQHGVKRGYMLAVLFLSAKIVETITQRQWIFGARQLGMRLRAALISHIYQKGLRLSSQSRQNHTSGEVINYMSVDIQRITDVIWYANIIWMLPIQVSLAISVLHKDLGLGAFAGLAATLLIMTCNIPLTRVQKQFQSKIMEAKDNRMKSMSEVLRNMKILKLQAWDMQYLHRLEGLRNIEYNWLWKSQKLLAFTSFIFWGSPAFISAVTFGSCILMGIPLTAGKVLSALATFRMLQDPIFSLPDLLSVLAQGKVSADRVALYLQEDEVKHDSVVAIPRNQTEFDVEVDNGQFSWDADSTFPTLDGITLKVKRGMKVAICGTVGSGKSSLLSCILGEIPKQGGTVKVSGSKAYVPQSPWILSGNVRENILFGRPYESAKYEKTIQSCALLKDFELFANGDMTEIGERGINMSGGQKQRIQIARAVYQDADIYLLDDPFSAVDAHTGGHLFKVNCQLPINAFFFSFFALSTLRFSWFKFSLVYNSMTNLRSRTGPFSTSNNEKSIVFGCVLLLTLNFALHRESLYKNVHGVFFLLCKNCFWGRYSPSNSFHLTAFS